VALKDRLDALKGPTAPAPREGDRALSVIPGLRSEQPAASSASPASPGSPAPPATLPPRHSEDPKQARVPTTLSGTKAAIHALLVERHADEIDISDREAVRSLIASLTDEYMRTAAISLTRLDYGHLVDALLDEVLGLGPLQPLLEDPAISEVMINHSRQIFVERRGRVMLSPVVFESDAQLRQVIDRVVSSVGRRVDESSPMCDARLRDGSRVNVVLPPLALEGPCMTIRKFSRDKLQPGDLLSSGSASADMMRYLEAAVRSRLSILVSGGTSSGKTTLLNILSSYIPSDERIVTIEDAAELQLRQEHIIRLEARPPNVEGKGAIEIRDLVRNSLRMRPDRILVGECRGGETLDMLQAMNTGHEGSMSTVHANSPHDAISRLEAMVLMAGTDLPSRAIQKQIASAVDVIVQAQRVRGGARKIVSICEVTGLTDNETQTQELFQFRQLGVDDDGNVVGFHTATGTPSVHMDHFAERAEFLSAAMFEPNSTAATGPA
jgi:pilus assembly protein CpaF